MIFTSLMIIIGLSTMQISAKTNITSKKTTQQKQQSEKKVAVKKKKPEYYRPGHSDGLQNWPGRSMIPTPNTAQWPNNTSSRFGNDVSF